MNLEVRTDEGIGYVDAGGGCCELVAVISVDPGMTRENQRRAVIHEALEVCLGYVMPHDKLCDIEDVVCEALELWEGL